MTLDDQLRAFHAIVTGAAPLAGASELVEAGRACAETRMHVYVHAYLARIADVLVNDYPKLATRLALRELVAPYLRAHPPAHPSLREVGQHLARFLGDRGEPRHLVDLATLERARIEAFDGGRDAVPMSRASLEALGPAAFPELTLRLVPSARIVELASNADDIWDALEEDRPAPDPLAGARCVLVWRRDTTVIHRTLAADEAPLVRSIAIGATFGAACELLADSPDPIARALELLLRWLDAGVLT
jgi:hypothetical protein